jgi:ABC-2 type transport system ATP-binding protein
VSAVIVAEQLTRRFGRHVAVDDLDLRIEGGGVVGLLGPNGSGKTTLLRMLATVLTPTRGRVEVMGHDPGHHDERTAIRRRLGYLPQDPALYGGFTAFDVVDYVAVLKEVTDRAVRHDEVRRVLAAVALDDAMHQKVRTLSGGMRQRVALACSLLGAPDLLVLDEPASGLDPDQRLQLRSVLSAHGQTGTVVLSTHHTTEVAAFCQRVLVLLDGRIRFDGTPADLARLADGQVWVDRSGTHDPTRSWVSADGTVRAIGSPPAGAELLAPTIDDGYLLLARGLSVLR